MFPIFNIYLSSLNSKRITEGSKIEMSEAFYLNKIKYALSNGIKNQLNGLTKSMTLTPNTNMTLKWKII